MFKRIPILIYHSIEPESSSRIYEDEKFYNITPDRFREQICYLKKNGYNTITLFELMRSKGDDKLPHKPVVLTFDDGHMSHYDTVLPILKEVGFSGIFFLVANDIGKEYRVNWEQARVLRDAGMDIGSHSLNHRILKKLPHLTLINEIKTSKSMLEAKLKSEIMAFSVPRGLYSRKISDIAREMGYKLVFTSFAGNITLQSNPFCLKRVVIRSDYSMKEFVLIIQNDSIFMLKKYIEQLAKNGIQKTIGIKGYDQIKKAIFSKV